MLWVHKNKPTNLDDLDFHDDITSTLRKLSAKEDFPHLLIYGPSGAGKKTRVCCLLRELFGPGALRLKEEQRTLTTGTRKFDFVLVSSSYHVEINPAEAGNYDRVVIQELLKDIAQTQQLDQQSKHRFKVVVINEADRLTRDAQAALRRTMEIYSPNFRLVLLANSTASIMAPIRSRTLLLRVPAPSVQQISAVLAKNAEAERVQIENKDEVFTNICVKSNRNLRRALLMLESMYAREQQITEKSVVPLADWQDLILQIASDIQKTRTVQKLAEIRKQYYELIAHCVPEPVILKELVFALIERVNARNGALILEAAATFDHRLRLGNKGIYHLEAFTARTMRILEG